MVDPVNNTVTAHSVTAFGIWGQGNGANAYYERYARWGGAAKPGGFGRFRTLWYNYG